MAKRALVLLLKAFCKEDFAEQFLDGVLHCETLSYHRKMDEQEGAVVILPSTTRRVTLNVGGQDFTEGIVKIAHRFSAADRMNVFCMYSWAPPFEDDTKERVILNKEEQLGSLRGLESQYGKYSVVVTDVEEFFNRIERSLDRSGDSISMMRGRRIEYELFDKIPVRTEEWFDMAFRKDPKYKGENEYRFVFVPKREDGGVLRLNIGSIRDIAKPMRTRDIYDSIKVNGQTCF